MYFIGKFFSGDCRKMPLSQSLAVACGRGEVVIMGSQRFDRDAEGESDHLTLVSADKLGNVGGIFE